MSRRPMRKKWGGKKRKTTMSNHRRYPAPIQFELKQGFMVQMRNLVSMTTDGSGVLAGVVPCNPNATLSSAFGSVAIFSEWTNWAALFASVKCVQLEVICKSKYVETKGDVPGVVVIGGNIQQGGSFPSTYATAADNTDSQTWNITNDTSGRGVYHAIRHLKKLMPAATNDPDPTGDAYIGCPGGIAFYGNALPITTSMMTVHIVGTYVVYSRT